MKIKAVILSFLFLLTGSGLKIEIATCCDALSGISINFGDNDAAESDDCHACVKASHKTSCCETQSISTVINPVLGLQKALTLSTKHSVLKYIGSNDKQAFLASNVANSNSTFSQFNQREYAIPILIQKRVLQI